MLKKLQHLAVIMDGNGRWATDRNLSRHQGHLKGVEPVKMLIQESAAHPDIEYLTLFAYSIENMGRPLQETQWISELLVATLKEQLDELAKKQILIRVVGDVKDIVLPNLHIPEPRLIVNVCFRYSGRWHISNIVNRLLDQGQVCSMENIQSLMVQDLGPDPDAIIRTGGELRVSNFLLWGMAYSELFFLPVLWPDFSKSDFDAVIGAFKYRDRRFGQVRSENEA